MTSPAGRQPGPDDGGTLPPSGAAPPGGPPPTRVDPATVAGGAPARFGPYRVVRELARGGMGVVIVAVHEQLGRRVALKLLQPGLPETARARFLTEARAAARLRHPNVVAIHEVGEAGGRPYLAMDLIEGESLRDRIDRAGPLEPREAARVVATVARAVYAAHRESVLHRDIKPHNVLLDARGAPYLTDFGLAKDVSQAEAGLTAEGEAMGTPAYMPPEQAEGRLDKVDRRSDVYSLGATLYEALTGTPPFGGGSALNVVVAVLSKDPTPPSKLRPGLDRDLETICLKCLEKARPARYDSAEALALDLERYLADEPIAARPVGPLERLWRRARRNRAVGRVVAVAALAVVAALAWALVGWSRAREARAVAEARGLAAARGELRAAAREHLARGYGLLASDRTDAARRAFEAAAGEVLAERARRSLGAPGGPDELAAEDAIVASAELGARAAAGREARFRRLYAGGAGHDACAFDPSGRRLAAGGEDGIRLWDLTGGSAAGPTWRAPPGGARPQALAFAPDGRRVFVGAAGGAGPRVRALDAATGEEVWRSEETAGEVSAFDVGWVEPGGVAVALSDGGLVLRDAATGSVRWRRTAADRRPDLDYATEAKQVRQLGPGGPLAVAYTDGLVGFWDPGPGVCRGTLHARARSLHGLASLPGGTFRGAVLVTADEAGGLGMWRAEGGERLVGPEDLLEGRGERIVALAASADGRRLAAASGAGTVWVATWDDRAWGAVDLRRFRLGASIDACALSPDGARAAAAGYGGVWTWRVDDRPGRPGQAPVAFVGDGAVALGTPEEASELEYGWLELRAAGSLGAAAADRRPLPISKAAGSDRIVPRAVAALGRERVVVAASDPTDPAPGAVEVWPVDGAEAPLARWPLPAANALAVGPGGALVAGAPWTDGPAPAPVVLFAAATGERRAELDWHRRTVTTVAFSPDGGRLASGDADGTVAVWDLAEAPGDPAFVIDASAPEEPVGAAGRPEGLRVAPRSSPAASRRVVHEVAFAPDGGVLAVALASGDVLLWSAAGGPAPLARVEAHEDAVVACAFAGAGEVLVTASRSGRVRLWDAAGRPPRLLRTIELDAGVADAAVSPDRTALLVATHAPRVELLDVALPPVPGFRDAALAAAERGGH